MKNQREAWGADLSIDWKSAAFGVGKNRRKTIGFGTYFKKDKFFEDEFYIKELSILDGGIGCAIWDAAIIFARYLYEWGPTIFHHQIIEETRQQLSTLSSPIQSIPSVDNKLQQIWNEHTKNVDKNQTTSESLQSVWVQQYRSLFKDKQILDNFFNQLSVLELGSGVGLPGIVMSRFCKQIFLTDYIDAIITNLQYNVSINASVLEFENGMFDMETVQWLYHLKQKQSSNTICELLNWDNVEEYQKEWQLVQTNATRSIQTPCNVDLIIGSELTYTGSTTTIHNLIKVIDTFLSEQGVFLEVLSDDRDGVEQFVKDAYELTKICFVRYVVPARYMGNFNTKQRPETYKFYIFYRESSKDTSPLLYLMNKTFSLMGCSSE